MAEHPVTVRSPVARLPDEIDAVAGGHPMGFYPNTVVEMACLPDEPAPLAKAKEAAVGSTFDEVGRFPNVILVRDVLVELTLVERELGKFHGC